MKRKNSGYYDHVQGKTLTGGAESISYVRKDSPLKVMASGPGKTAGQLFATANQNIFAPLSIPIASFGGLQAGTVGLYPLSVAPQESAPE